MEESLMFMFKLAEVGKGKERRGERRGSDKRPQLSSGSPTWWGPG